MKAEIKEYLAGLPQERQGVMAKLLETIQEQIDPKFDLILAYGMPSFVVPLSLYPGGYHCTGAPLPYFSLAWQKNYLSVYPMALYGQDKMAEFKEMFQARTQKKVDAGKGCLRFKKINEIPMDLIAELAASTTLADYVQQYAAFDPRNKEKS